MIERLDHWRLLWIQDDLLLDQVLAACVQSWLQELHRPPPWLARGVPFVADVKSKFTDEDDMLLANDTRMAEACLLAGVVCFLRLDVSLGSARLIRP